MLSRSQSVVMDWSENHNILLAREVLVSEPFRFKPRTVERGKVWQEITDRLNSSKVHKFRVTKRSTREHFNLLLGKYKAKRQSEIKLSGVDIEDSELDDAMEEIWEKWEAAEAQHDIDNLMNKKKVEEDRVNGEEVRKKACEKLGETSKRKSEEDSETKPKKSRRGGSDTIDFLREKAKLDLAFKQEERKCKQQEQERQSQLYGQVLTTQQQQQQQQTQMMHMMQQQSQAMLTLMAKLVDK